MTPGARTQLTEWAHREVARIEALSDEELVIEVTNVMNGDIYSWKSIQTRMQQLDANPALRLEWSSLWNLKKKWERFDSVTQQNGVVPTTETVQSLRNPQALRVLLVKPKLITSRAGLGKEGRSDPCYP